FYREKYPDSPAELDQAFEEFKERDLTPFERELFWFFLDGPGKEVHVEFEPHQYSHSNFEEGHEYVIFSHPSIRNGRPDPYRSLLNVMKHEMAHVVDGLNVRQGRTPELAGLLRRYNHQ